MGWGLPLHGGRAGTCCGRSRVIPSRRTAILLTAMAKFSLIFVLLVVLSRYVGCYDVVMLLLNIVANFVSEKDMLEVLKLMPFE